MERLRVDIASAAGTYPVHIAEGLITETADLLRTARGGSRQIAVSSPTVWRLHGRAVSNALPDAEPVLVPDGERFKHLATVSRIYDALIRAEADRATSILAVGGGVIGDVAGFAAATYLRGLTLVQVPTTLVAQIDSAIGGKVGVNLPQGKNLVGAFYPPALVVVDPLVLRTLPRREFRSGVYEMVKYAMTSSEPLFDRLRRELPALFAKEPRTLVPMIAECCRIKAAVVSADERESGPRRVLNFGHTAGHSLEALTRYRRFRHGEAVAYGMLVAAEVAVARGALPDAARSALAETIVQLGPLPPVGDLSTRLALESMRRDKKIVDGRLHFVLPTAVGSTVIADDVTEAELERALRKVGLKS